MNLTIPQLLFTWTVLAIGINVFLIACYGVYRLGCWFGDWLIKPRWQVQGPVGFEAELAIINRIQEKKPPAVMHPANPSILEHIDEAIKENKARETARRQALSHGSTCMPYGGENFSYHGTTCAPQIDSGFPYESVTKDHVDAMYPQRFDYFRHK